jgi:DNA methylase
MADTERTCGEYRGVNTLKAGRAEELALHPTVKPVAMIADAIKDVSKRGGIMLDLFGGSGLTLIAAHKTGRRARVCELDPVYCDRILCRWETFAKDDAELIACGLSPKARTLGLGAHACAGEADSAFRNALKVQSWMSDDRKIRLELLTERPAYEVRMASRLWPHDLSPDVQAIQGLP